jgi:engulfment/cell motility protein 1
VPSGALALNFVPRADGHRTISSVSNPAGRRFSKQSSDTVLPPANSASTNAAASNQPLSFTLHSSSGPLVSLLAPTASIYSEWVDGLSLLRPASSSGGSISTRTTADYVNDLTEIAVKVKLLDLSGERVEVLGGVEVGKVPRSTAFFYSDSL